MLIQNISKGVRQNEALLNTVKDEIVKQRLEREIEDAQELIKKIDQDNETVGFMTILIMVLAESEEELQKRAKRIESKITSMNMKIRSLANLSKKSFKSVAPFETLDPTIRTIASRNVPLSTFIGGLPFASAGFNDGKGYYFAKDTENGVIVMDTWKRAGDRTNSNFVITGTAGVGKSTVAKHLLVNEYMTDTKIIVIDPEREYKELVKNLDGDWIDLGGGQNGMINPLQIKEVPLDETGETVPIYVNKGHGLGAMALHFQTLRTFFQLLFPELTSIQIALLEETMEELYNQFNIYWDTDISDLKNNQFPILSDLYQLLKMKVENTENIEKKKEYEILQSLIRSISIGADSVLFNGHTTVLPKTNCICFDTYNLQNSSDKIKKAQYFNALTFCWEIMSRNKTEKTMLFCDEAYLLIDRDCPQSLAFLRNVSKRCRKYESSLVIISHSIVDFLDPTVKLYRSSNFRHCLLQSPYGDRWEKFRR